MTVARMTAGPARLKGPIAAALTPQFDSGAIHTAGLARHCQWLLENGCSGIALFGTTGEAECFTNIERMSALETLLRQGVPAEAILVGTGRAAVGDTISLTRHAVSCGVRNLLVLPPFYYPNPTEDGVYRAFSQMTEKGPAEAYNIYLYHFPEMSGVPITPALIEQLRNNYPEHFVGLKDSTGDFGGTVKFAEISPDFDVFTGDDNLLGPMLDKGGAGSITATANIAPHLLREVYDGWTTDSQAAQAAHAMLETIWLKGLLEYPVTEALKEYLAHKTGDAGWLNMRAPLSRLNSAQRTSMLATFDASGFQHLPTQNETLRERARS